MLNRMFKLGMGTMAAGLLGLGLSSQAAVVSVNGTPIFNSGGFEFDTVGVAPTNPPPAIGAYDGTPTATVINGAAPGPYAGSNYLSISKAAAGTIGMSGVMSASKAAADVMHVAAWVYLPSASNGTGGTSLLNLRFRSDSGTDDINIGTYPNNFGTPNSVWYGSAGNYLTTSANFYQQDTWQLWEVEYDLDAGLVQFWVDGVGVVPFAPLLTSAAPVIENWGILNGANIASTIYVDGDPIPEPAGIALLGLGGLALLRRNRRMV